MSILWFGNVPSVALRIASQAISAVLALTIISHGTAQMVTVSISPRCLMRRNFANSLKRNAVVIRKRRLNSWQQRTK